jgi:YHS domain-containing protein
MSTIIHVDPICGMVLAPESAVHTCTYASWTYLFCCAECLEIFRRDPDTCVAYLAHSRSAHVGHRCCVQRAAQPQPRGVAL